MSAEKTSMEIRHFTHQIIKEDITTNHMERGQKETVKGLKGAAHITDILTTDILMVPGKIGLEVMAKLKDVVFVTLYGISTISAPTSRQQKRAMKKKRKKMKLTKILVIYHFKKMLIVLNSAIN